MKKIDEILKERILVLDGAMGTMIQKYKLEEADFRGDRFKDFHLDLKGNNDLLSITKPKIIGAIHEEYLAAGADIIETNTFSSTSIGMADYELEKIAYELNVKSARIAREAADKYTALTPDKPRFVAGSIGPTNRTASMSPEVNSPAFRAVNFDQLRIAYKEQIEGLIEGGADILLIETIFDTLNAKAALFACEEVFDTLGLQLPIMISGTITDASGRLLSGQTPEAFLISVNHIPLLSFGLNCALGAAEMQPYLQQVSRISDAAICAYPNAGLPNAFGEYDQSAHEFTEEVKSFLDLGLINIIGGCCGTQPQHIKLLSELVEKYKPRSITAW